MFKKLTSFLLLAQHYILLKIKVYGNNKLDISKDTILWKSNIKVVGKNNIINIGKAVVLKHTKIKIQGENNKIIIGENVRIYENCEFLIEGDNCEINIGQKTTIGSANIFCGEGNSSISIGENCMLSREVSMNTSDFHSIIDVSTNSRINPPKNIIIGDHVWIGFNTTIILAPNKFGVIF